jgi:hypothetical protein
VDLYRSRWIPVVLPILLACGGCGDDAASPNIQPVAIAGPDQLVEVRTDAVLDGSQSYDPDGDPIFFQWQLAGVSDQAWLSRADQALVRLTPRVVGVFMVRLTVDDGRLDSEPDIVRVYAVETQIACQTDADCDDENPCTDDSCGPEDECVWTPNTDPCDDDLFCTLEDSCDGTGICTGSGSPCTETCQTSCNENTQSCQASPDGTACGSGNCQEGQWVGQTCEAGECTEIDTISCDDGKECTEDTCDDQTGCANEELPDATPCDQGLGVCCAGECTQGASCCQHSDCGTTTDCAVYTCQAGECFSQMLESGQPCDGGDQDLCNSTCDGNGACVDDAMECDDGNYCNGEESCDSSNGSCQSSGNLGAGGYCDGDYIVYCDGNGGSTDPVYCALGCNAEADPLRCYQVDPSNFEQDYLCENAYDAVLSGEVVIDTDNRSITGIQPAYIVFFYVDQDSPAKELGVFSFNSITILPGANVTVVGDRALALAACTDVTIDGVIDASAAGQTGGPGGFDGGAVGEDGEGPAPGIAAQPGTTDCPNLCSAGGGGGSFGSDAGDGGAVSCRMNNGLVEMTGGEDGDGHGRDTLVPLIGGCGGAGGTPVTGVGSSRPGTGGGGGGAIQIVAGGLLTIGPAAGIVAAGAGGGETISGGGAGGGAGGGILIEAAHVELADGAFLTANGGGGGGGDCT